MIDMRNAGVCMLGIFWACLGSAGAANTLTAAEKKAGWILLFDGIHLKDHWKVGEDGTDNGWDPKTSWELKDSALHIRQTASSNLFTKDTYTDFEFSIDVKMGPGGNSGIFFRVTSPPGWFCSGSEYALLDDAAGGDRGETSKNPADKLPNGKMAYVKRTGANYDMYPTTKNGAIGGQYYDSTVFLPVPQWNRAVVWANGNAIEHWLNNQKVVDYETGSPDWEERFKLSKFYNQCSGQRATWSKNKSGCIGMQGHGANLEVSFRNLKIRPFNPGEPLVSPSIAPDGGNFSGTVKVGLEVAITGAVIRYTLDGSTPTASSPAYTDSLAINATTVVKAIATRDGFKNSSVSSVEFTKAGSSVSKTDLSPPPEVGISPAKNGLHFRNINGQHFSGKILTLSGRIQSFFNVDASAESHSIRGLDAGLYFVKISRGDWTRSYKVAIP